MAYTAHITAIDDSFEENLLPAAPPSASGRASTLCGPRAGHWSVRSGTGSAVDDRCSTVWNEDYLADGQHDEDGECDRAIRGELLKRLELATVEEEKRKPAAQDLEAETVRTITASATVKESKARGFYVPASVGGRELKQPAKPIKDGQPPPVATKVKQKTQKQDNQVSGPATNLAPTSATRSKSQGIRITSKDGREAFVTLPYQPYLSSAPPTVLVSSSHKRGNEGREQAQAPREAQDKTRRRETQPPEQQNKDKAQSPKSDQPKVTKKQQKKKDKQAKQAEQEPSPSVKPLSEPRVDWKATDDVESRKRSIKDSAIGFGKFFDDAPVSKALLKAPSAAVPAKSLVSAVRSISENSEKHSRESGWFTNGASELARHRPAIEGDVMTYKPTSAAPSDAVSADALRAALAHISQHNKKSDDGSAVRSESAGSGWQGGPSADWGPATVSPSNAEVNADAWAKVKTVQERSERSEIRPGWGAPSTAAGAGEMHQGIWDQGSDLRVDGFRSPIDRASTLKPWSATQSDVTSMQSLRDRIKTISENSRKSGDEYAAAALGSARKLRIEQRSTRSFSMPTEVWNQGMHSGSAHLRQSRASESVDSEEPANHDYNQPMPPIYDGFRVLGEGVINARFEPERNSFGGIRERGEGWIYPQSDASPEAKQHSSEPPYKHFYGNRPSSAAASDAFPRKPTVFAGLGWIERHPLSIAPSPYGTPVQSHVGLPRGADKKLPAEHRGKDNLSFEEWREVQQSTFQAEATVVSSVRSSGALPSAASDSVYSQVRRYATENQPPSLVRSLAPTPAPAPASRRSEHIGAWSERDGEVHLHMPWDQQ